jgi:hypothetical protein
MAILRSIIIILLCSSCFSYVPTTERQAKKVIRKLENRNQFNTKRIIAISNTYNLSRLKKEMASGVFTLPSITIESPFNRTISTNIQFEGLLNKYKESTYKMESEQEVLKIKKQLQQMTFGKQEFIYNDEFINAIFLLDPGQKESFKFTYKLTSRNVDVEIPVEKIIVDAGKEYYNFWQFWVLLLLWMGSISFIAFTIVKARN